MTKKEVPEKQKVASEKPKVTPPPMETVHKGGEAGFTRLTDFVRKEDKKQN